MTKREVCFLISTEGQIIHADISDSAYQIADSHERWRLIWQHREQLAEIAHSHPDGGAFFSLEDATTMSALSSALNQDIVFSVVTGDQMIRHQQGRNEILTQEPWWADLLRCASGIDLKKES